MSNVHISIVKAVGANSQGTSMLVESSGSFGSSAAETIVSSGASQAATITPASQSSSDEPSKYAWRVANMGSDAIYIAFGGDATAAGKGIPAGAICYFGCEEFGDTIEVINA